MGEYLNVHRKKVDIIVKSHTLYLHQGRQIVELNVYSIDTVTNTHTRTYTRTALVV